MDILSTLYEQYGIILDEELLSEDDDPNGLAMGKPGKPTIVLIKPGMSDHKRRFTMAHELGHVLAGHTSARPFRLSDPQAENEANIFACALLAVSLAMGQWMPTGKEVPHHA